MATLEADPRENPDMHEDERASNQNNNSKNSSANEVSPYVSPTLSLMEPPRPVELLIPNYRTVESNGKPSHSVFVILVKWKATRGPPIAWTVSHRFSDFDALHKTLSRRVGNLPPLPQKSWGWWKSFSPDFVNKRRVDLEKYLCAINNIDAVALTEQYQKFLDVNLHVKNLRANHLPSSKTQLVDEMFGYGDLIYDRERALMLTACSESHVSNRIDAHVSNFRFPWEEKGVVTPVGSSSVWIIVDGEWTAVNTEYYEVGATSIAWDALRNYIFVGLDNGHIMIYLLDLDGEQITLVEELVLHTDKVSGLVYDAKLDVLVSCSKDRLMTMVDVGTRGLLCSTEQASTGHSSVVIDSDASVMFVGSYGGLLGAIGSQIDVYNISEKQFHHVTTLTGHSDSVRCLHYDPKQSYLFSGGFDYMVGIWQIPKADQLYRSRSVGWLTGGPRSQIKCVTFARSLNYVIAGHKSGFVTIWNVVGGAMLYSWHAHKNEVKRLIWMDDTATLLTASADGYLRFWTIPSTDSQVDSPDGLKEVFSAK